MGEGIVGPRGVPADRWNHAPSSGPYRKFDPPGTSYSAPQVAGARKRGEESMPPSPPDAPTPPQPGPAPVAMVTPQERELRNKLRELREHLVKNADYVGGRFPEEARRMHYGEIEHRSIYGEASPDQAKELHEEGIEFHPLPVLPDERN